MKPIYARQTDITRREPHRVPEKATGTSDATLKNNSGGASLVPVESSEPAQGPIDETDLAHWLRSKA